MADFGDNCNVLDKAYQDAQFDPSTCALVLSGEGVPTKVFDLSAVADKVVQTSDVVTSLRTVDGVLNYVNEAGTLYPIPQLPPTAYTVDSTGCVLSLTNNQGLVTVFDPLSRLSIDRVGNELIIDKCGVRNIIPIPPDTVPSTVTVDQANGVVTHRSGDSTTTIMDICLLATRCKPVVTVVNNPDGSQTITHNDGYGVTRQWATQPTVLDTQGEVSVNGSVITFRHDGQDVPVDICALVAAGCNSTFTNITTAGWSHVDNAGRVQEFTLPDFVSSVCYVNANGVQVTGARDANGKVQLPYERISMRCETSTGGFVNVTFDPATGQYTIPYKEPSMSADQFGTVNSAADPDNFVFTFPDGTTALVCKEPAKTVVAGSSNVTVAAEPNGVFRVSVDATDAVSAPVQSVACMTARGEVLVAPIDNNGQALIPFKPEVIRCETDDGDFLFVSFDAATGMYTIPYKSPPVQPDTNTFAIPEDLGNNQVRVTYPNGQVHTYCTAPVKSVRIAGGGSIDNTDPQNPIITVPPGTTDTFAIPEDIGNNQVRVTYPNGQVHTYCTNPVKSVTGTQVDDTDPTNPIVNSPYTVSDTAPAGDTKVPFWYDPVSDCFSLLVNGIWVAVGKVPVIKQAVVASTGPNAFTVTDSNDNVAIIRDQKLVNGAAEALVADQGPANDAFCVQEPLQVCINGAYSPAPKNHQMPSPAMLMGTIRAVGPVFRHNDQNMVLGEKQDCTPIASYTFENPTCEDMTVVLHHGAHYAVRIYGDAQYEQTVEYSRDNGVIWRNMGHLTTRGGDVGNTGVNDYHLDDHLVGQTQAVTVPANGNLTILVKSTMLWAGGVIQPLDAAASPTAIISYIGGYAPDGFNVTTQV